MSEIFWDYTGDEWSECKFSLALFPAFIPLFFGQGTDIWVKAENRFVVQNFVYKFIIIKNSIGLVNGPSGIR